MARINVILDPQEAVVSKWFFDLKGNRTGIAEWQVNLDGCEHADADYQYNEIFCPECEQVWEIGTADNEGYYVGNAGGVYWYDEETDGGE